MKLSVIIFATLCTIVSTTQGAENKILRFPIIRSQPMNKVQRLHKRDMFGAGLHNANGKEYLVEVGVGTPPQLFNLTLDTGSADFWVPSTSCPVDMCPHTRFNPQKSSTFQSLPQQLNIEYGIGSAQGVYGVDTVKVGQASLPNQTIGLVANTQNILSPAGSDDNSNGILGLGYPNLSMKTGKKPGHFVMGLYESKIISEPVFSIFLNSHFTYGLSGQVVLGGVDSTKFSGKIQYAPVVNYDVSKYYISPNIGANSTKNGMNLYWAIPGQGVSTSTGFKNETASLNAYILDTGTTLTYIPAKLAKDMVMSITKNAKTTQLDNVNGVYRVDCDTAKKSNNATVQFMISTSLSTKSTTPIVLDIPVSELVVPLDDALTTTTSQSCMFGIAPSPAGLELTSGETWILGESVLRSLYTVYDMKNNQVGLAPVSPNAGNTGFLINGTTTSSGTNPNHNGQGGGGGDNNGGSTAREISSANTLLTPFVLQIGRAHV